MIRNSAVVLSLMSALIACDNPQAMEARPFEAEIEVARNYQAVYADTLATMRLCVRPGASFFPSPGETTLDAQLYSDLGYGEIRNGISGVVPQT
jgi:hypothetical protein